MMFFDNIMMFFDNIMMCFLRFQRGLKKRRLILIKTNFFKVLEKFLYLFLYLFEKANFLPNKGNSLL